MMATEQPIAHTEEQQHYDEAEMGEGEEEVSRSSNLLAGPMSTMLCRHGVLHPNLSALCFPFGLVVSLVNFNLNVFFIFEYSF
jgi:hypothetical protein